MDIKWVGDDAKIKKLKKLVVSKKSEIDNALTEAAKFKAEKEKLEEDKSITNRLRKIEEEISNIEESAYRVKVEYEEYGSTATTPAPYNKDGRGKYANFISSTYDYKGKLNKWIKDNSDVKYDNRYEVDLGNGSKIFTHEGAGARIIGQEIVFQLAKIDDTDFATKIAASSAPSHVSGGNATRLKTLLTNIKTYASELDATHKDESDGLSKIGNKIKRHGVTTFNHEYSTKKPTLKYDELFEFVEKLAPLTEMSGMDGPFFKKLTATTGQDWGTNQKFYIPEVKDSPATEQELKMFGTNLSEFEKAKNIYMCDSSKGKNIDIKAGLEGWIELYYMIFKNKTNREKIIRSVNGDGTVTTSIENEIISNYNDATFIANCSYLSELKDEDDNQIRVFCIANPNEVVNKLKLRERELETQKKILEEGELKDQIKLRAEHDKKIGDEKLKIEAEDAKIDALVKAEVVAKQQKVTDVTSWGNTEWSESKNVLKAAATKKVILDIKWLENNGNDNLPLKNPTNKNILDAIETKRAVLPIWNAVIKKSFEDLGSDLDSRIAAAKADTEIGLEIYYDTYTELGDTTVANAIKAEIDKEKPQTPPSEKIKLPDLQNALSAKSDTSESDLNLDAWDTILKKSGSKISDKDKLSELIKKVGKGATDDEGKKKYGRWEEHLAKHSYGDAKVEGKGDDQWNTFIKKSPKIVIGAILYFDYEESSDDEKKKIKNEIKEAVKTALGTDGKKELAETYEIKDDDKEETIRPIVTKYLYRREMGRTGEDLVKTKLKQEPDKKPDDDSKKPQEVESSWKDWFVFRSGNVLKPMVTYVGILLLVFGVAAAIFWKSIMNWWNGPAEEVGAMGDEDENKGEES